MVYRSTFNLLIWSIVIVLLSLVSALTSLAGPIYDFDGDGRSDFVIFQNSGDDTQIRWFILQSRDGFGVRYWGYQYPSGSGILHGPISGDFDGDGKWDAAVLQSQSGMPNWFWFIQNSHDGSMTARPWGLLNDQYVHQDYDGDGKTDLAMFRDGWWYILRSSDGQFQAEKFGTTSDNPIQGGDYDGDGKADLSIVRIDNGYQQWIRLSGTGFWKKYSLGNPQFTGVVTGDYDGDGKSDVAIVQGNLWLWERSSDGQLGGGWRFGNGQQDDPVPADYDGDGKTDIAVYRNLSGQRLFYVLQSRDGYLALQWGGIGAGRIADRRYIRPTGFRPAGSKAQAFEDKGPFPRLVETGKN